MYVYIQSAPKKSIRNLYIQECRCQLLVLSNQHNLCIAVSKTFEIFPSILCKQDVKFGGFISSCLLSFSTVNALSRWDANPVKRDVLINLKQGSHRNSELFRILDSYSLFSQEAFLWREEHLKIHHCVVSHCKKNLHTNKVFRHVIRKKLVQSMVEMYRMECLSWYLEQRGWTVNYQWKEDIFNDEFQKVIEENNHVYVWKSAGETYRPVCMYSPCNTTQMRFTH